MKVELEIVGLSVGQSPGVYSLILGEVNGKRKLPIIIGNFEAQSIAVVLEGVSIKKPLTHDLIKNLIDQFGATLNELHIYKLEEGIFHSNFLFTLNGDDKLLETRTSDGVAVALRMGCPIMVDSTILEEAGIELDELDQLDEPEMPERPSVQEDDYLPGSKSFEDDLSKFTILELEKMLEDFLNIEDYRNAAIVRDELENRKG